MLRRLLPLALVVLAPSLIRAQEPAAQASPTAAAPADDETVRREETVVVTASKVEQALVNAPATLSVISNEILLTTPAQNYADLFRSVPGMNAIQMSARDVNLTGRQATSTLS